MLQLMQQNIALNDMHNHVAASVYEWGGQRPTALPEYPDIVLAGEQPRDVPQSTRHFC